MQDRPQRHGRVLLAARGGAAVELDRARGDGVARHAAEPEPGAHAARPVPVHAATRSSARCRCCPAASGGGCRWRGWSPAARTSSCSTSRRTTSTSRAARRSRTRIDAYDGTVLFVSHDRALIDAVATHTLALEDQTLTLRIGDYNDYMAAKSRPPRRRRRPRSRPRPAGRPRRSRSRSPRAPEPEPERRPTAHRRSGCGGSWPTSRRASPTARPRSRRLESELADPAVIADYELLATVAEKHRAVQEELAWLYREWETVARVGREPGTSGKSARNVRRHGSHPGPRRPADR